MLEFSDLEKEMADRIRSVGCGIVDFGEDCLLGANADTKLFGYLP